MITPKTIANGILRAIGIITAILLLLYFLYKIEAVLVYIIVAAVISLIGRPIVLFLKQKLKFGSPLAAIVTMLIFLALITGLVSLFVPLIYEQGENLALLNTDDLQQNIQNLYSEITAYFQLNHINIEQSIRDSGMLSKIDYSILPTFLNNIVSGLGTLSIGLFSVLFISFFFLKDSRLFEKGITTFIPSGNENKFNRSFKKIKILLSRYFVGLVFQILILFIIYTIVLLIFGIKNALVIAFLCALLNLIPYVGPLISAILMLLLSMSSNLGESFSTVILPKTTYVMIGFVIAQLVDNFFSQPFIFSKSVKSHPLEIFLIIIIGGIIFGVTGMIVAVPSYTALKVILKEFLNDYDLVKKLTKNV